MDQGQQHLVAAGFEFERHFAAAPGERKAARRVEFGDAALHAVLGAEAVGARAGRIGQLVVAPGQFERRVDLQVHVAGGEPLAAEVALREVGPDAFDRAGQQALQAHGARRGDGGVVGVGCGGLDGGVHGLLRGVRVRGGGVRFCLRAGLRTDFAASSASSSAARASSLLFQKRS